MKKLIYVERTSYELAVWLYSDNDCVINNTTHDLYENFFPLPFFQHQKSHSLSFLFFLVHWKIMMIHFSFRKSSTLTRYTWNRIWSENISFVMYADKIECLFGIIWFEVYECFLYSNLIIKYKDQNVLLIETWCFLDVHKIYLIKLFYFCIKRFETQLFSWWVFAGYKWVEKLLRYVNNALFLDFLYVKFLAPKMIADGHNHAKFIWKDLFRV